MNVAPALAASSAWAGREAQGHVDHRPVAGQRLAGLEAVRGQRHLDRDIVGDLPKHLGLAHHSVIIERDDLGRHRPADTIRAISLHTSMKSRPDLWTSEGLVVTPSSRPGVGKLADLGDFGGVGEEFHGLRGPGFGGFAAAIAGWHASSHPIREGNAMSEHVRVEQRGGVLAITLARPERRNAITVAMYAALADAIEQARRRRWHPAHHDSRRRAGFHRRQRPRRFPATALPRDADDIPVWRLLRALAAQRSCRSSPRSMAMRSASAPPCCSTATS